MPLFYLLVSLLNRLLSHPVGLLRRRFRRNAELPDPQILSRSVRLLVLALGIRWMLSRFTLPLLARQFWSTTATIITITAGVWLFIHLNNWFEKLVGLRLADRMNPGITSVVRLGRRLVDVLAVIVGVLFALYHFGVKPYCGVCRTQRGWYCCCPCCSKNSGKPVRGQSGYIEME
jgi:small-conductance mechanosensitive channel